MKKEDTVQVPRKWLKEVGKLISKCHDQDNITALLTNVVALFNKIEEVKKYFKD